MRKGRDGGKKKRGKKTGEKNACAKNGEKKEKRWMKIVATTSLPAVDCPNAEHWNAARSCQFQFKVQDLFKLNTFDLNLVNSFVRPLKFFCGWLPP